MTVDAEVTETEDKADNEGEKKIFFEIKSLPRPHAPDHMKRQASLRAFVPSPKQEAFKTTNITKYTFTSFSFKQRIKTSI